MFFRRVSSRISICLSFKKKKKHQSARATCSLPAKRPPRRTILRLFNIKILFLSLCHLYPICLKATFCALGGEFSQEERLFAKSKVEKPGHGAMTKYKKRKKKETFQEELCYDPVVPTLTSLPPSGVNTSRKGSEMKVEIHTVNLRLQIKQPGEKKIPSFVDLLSVH